MSREMTDEVRAEDERTIYRRFITPKERQRRIMAAGEGVGLNTIQKLAEAHKMTWTQMKNTMIRENVSIRSLMKVALTLNVPMSYLTER